jgi:hypothetical protein
MNVCIFDSTKNVNIGYHKMIIIKFGAKYIQKKIGFIA